MAGKVVDVNEVLNSTPGEVVTPSQERQGLLDVPNDVPHASHDETSERGDCGSKSRQSGLFDFANPEAIKEKVRNAKKPKNKPYDVFDEYHETGCFQRLAKDPMFENITLGVIVVNALWISIDTDYNKEAHLGKAHIIFVIFDSSFFLYFSFELIVRFCAFANKCHCFRDAWFVFDTTLVLLYLFDPFILTILAVASNSDGPDLPTSILRLFRLARLSRLVRMLRSLPELMIMIKGMITAAQSVSYTLGLLLVVNYVFAIALVQLADDKPGINEAFFSSVPLAMYSLFVYATFVDNLADFFNAVKDESMPCLVLCTIFVILGCLTIMNMLIGVLCEVISAVAAEEKESMITDKVHEKFGAIVNDLDTDNDKMLSWKEFQQIMTMPIAIDSLESVNVDPVGMIDFAEDFFFDDGVPRKLSFDQFMDMLLDLRGGQSATLKDVMVLGKRVNRKFSDIRVLLDEIEAKAARVLKTL